MTVSVQLDTYSKFTFIAGMHVRIIGGGGANRYVSIHCGPPNQFFSGGCAPCSPWPTVAPHEIEYFFLHHGP